MILPQTPALANQPAGGHTLVSTLLVALCALLLLGGGVALRWPSVSYHPKPKPPSKHAVTDNTPQPQTPQEEQADYNTFAFSTFSYTDIASLYFRDALATHPRPFFDYPLEYPVGIGLLIYLLNSATTLHSYLLLSSAFLALCALVTLWLIGYIPGSNRWLLALSPALLLHSNLNWDFWGILLTIAALFVCIHRQAAWGGILLAAAVWTKFFPVVLVPLVALLYLTLMDRRAVVRLLAGFTGATLFINAPLLLLKPQAWWYFFQVNQRRAREVNLWTFFDSYHLTTQTINTGSSLLLIAGVVGLLGVLWQATRSQGIRLRAERTRSSLTSSLAALLLPACCAAIAWFFFINKVYSPQYGVWIAVLLAAAGASSALAVAWGAADLIYFTASFTTLGMSPFARAPGGVGPFDNAVGWVYHYILLPAMGLREAMLLLIVVWGVWRIQRGRSSPTTSQTVG